VRLALGVAADSILRVLDSRLELSRGALADDDTP
jgi:hypothetical protein